MTVSVHSHTQTHLHTDILWSLPLEAEKRAVGVTVSVHSHMQTHLHTDILWSLPLEAESRAVSVTVSVHSHMQTLLHTYILWVFATRSREESGQCDSQCALTHADTLAY